MRRLTTDTPNGNWEIMLNFVFGQDGWAHIRPDGENENIPLTQWAKAQCLRNGCGEFSAEAPNEIDEEICDCMMSFPDCPIALAYCFASQACHLRSRLKLYEDILFDKTGKERLTLDDLRELAEPNDPLTLEELRKMDGEPVWVIQPGYKLSYGLVRVTWTVTILIFNDGKMVAAEFAMLENGCKIYRRKLEEEGNDHEPGEGH